MEDKTLDHVLRLATTNLVWPPF